MSGQGECEGIARLSHLTRVTVASGGCKSIVRELKEERGRQLAQQGRRKRSNCSLIGDFRSATSL